MEAAGQARWAVAEDPACRRRGTTVQLFKNDYCRSATLTMCLDRHSPQTEILRFAQPRRRALTLAKAAAL